MARKYGIIAASDLKIGAVRGADMRSGSIHMPRKNVGPAPANERLGNVRAGVRDWGSMVAPLGAKLNRGIAQASQRSVQQRQQRQAEGRAATMPQHPSVRSQGAVASSTGGNAPGAIPGPNTAPSAATYYEAPKNMGAKVPVSRAAKFTQGRGL